MDQNPEILEPWSAHTSSPNTVLWAFPVPVPNIDDHIITEPPPHHFLRPVQHTTLLGLTIKTLFCFKFKRA